MKISLTRGIVANLVWITFCVLVIIFSERLPIEFSSTTVKSFSFVILCFGLPASLIWIGYQFYKSTTFVIVTSILSLLFIALTLLGEVMCGTTDEILYTNRKTKSIIVASNYDCGAWDSDFPDYTYYKKTPFIGIFYLKSKVDTSRLDKSVWIRQ